MSPGVSERDRLLPSSGQDVVTPGLPASRRRPGPLDITRANRYGILAGIWVASFLGVRSTCFVLLNVIFLNSSLLPNVIVFGRYVSFFLFE